MNIKTNNPPEYQHPGINRSYSGMQMVPQITFTKERKNITDY